MDAAEFWGVLHRLHRAGLRLRSVDRLGPGRKLRANTVDARPSGTTATEA